MVKKIQCPTVLLHPQAKPPKQGNSKAAGHDIACVAGVFGIDLDAGWDDEQLAEWAAMEQRGYIYLQPGDSFLFRTGFAQAIEPGHMCLFWDRSGMGGKKQMHRMAGVIDEDYRGEWFVCLVNHSKKTHRINVGDKIVQGIYQERIEAECPVIDAFTEETERGTAGFGSTDAVTTEEGSPKTDAPKTDTPKTDTPKTDTPPEEVAVRMLTAPAALVRSTVAIPDKQTEEITHRVADPEIADIPAGFKSGGIVVYDGQNAANALVCMRDRQYDNAIAWIKRDNVFFKNGTPIIIPDTLSTVPGRQAVSFYTAIPIEK